MIMRRMLAVRHCGLSGVAIDSHRQRPFDGVEVMDRGQQGENKHGQHAERGTEPAPEMAPEDGHASINLPYPTRRLFDVLKQAREEPVCTFPPRASTPP